MKKDYLGKLCLLRGMLSGSRTLLLDPLHPSLFERIEDVLSCGQGMCSVVGPGFIPPNYMLPDSNIASAHGLFCRSELWGLVLDQLKMLCSLQIGVMMKHFDQFFPSLAQKNQSTRCFLFFCLSFNVSAIGIEIKRPFFINYYWSHVLQGEGKCVINLALSKQASMKCYLGFGRDNNINNKFDFRMVDKKGQHIIARGIGEHE